MKSEGSGEVVIVGSRVRDEVPATLGHRSVRPALGPQPRLAEVIGCASDAACQLESD